MFCDYFAKAARKHIFGMHGTCFLVTCICPHKIYIEHVLLLLVYAHTWYAWNTFFCLLLLVYAHTRIHVLLLLVYAHTRACECVSFPPHPHRVSSVSFMKVRIRLPKLFCSYSRTRKLVVSQSESQRFIVVSPPSLSHVRHKTRSRCDR